MAGLTDQLSPTAARPGRRQVLGAGAALAGLAALPARARAANAGQGWTHDQFVAAMRRSGRPIEQSQAEFDAIQARRPAYLQRIESYLKDRLGSADPAVLQAFASVPREYFHYQYADRRAEPGVAYEADAKPWALGYGSALSDYLGQAYMTQVCKPQPGEVTL